MGFIGCMGNLDDALLADAERLLRAALAEDLGAPDPQQLSADADITSAAVIPADATFSGVITARQPCVVAGLPFACATFRLLSEEACFMPTTVDGMKVPAGYILAHVRGPARALLAAERTALNLLQHLSGIATRTRAFIEAMGETQARLLDTRKTIPGLRRLEKYATQKGGAHNHRFGLHDAILIKDNHIAVASSVAEAVRRAKAAGHAQVEVECDTLEQVKEALKAGATRVLLDNMDTDTLKQAVALARGKAETEASGGITLENIAEVAATGVDYISVGSALTLSAPAIDIGLDWHTT